jgi:hypothetical protein
MSGQAEWTALVLRVPEEGQKVDWITGDGQQVDGGRYVRGLWFLPPDHSMYAYYVPTLWRPAKGE